MKATANLGGDPTLFGPESVGAVQGFAQTMTTLLEKPPGSGMTLDDVAEIAVWESKLATLYVQAMQRILSDSMPRST